MLERITKLRRPDLGRDLPGFFVKLQLTPVRVGSQEKNSDAVHDATIAGEGGDNQDSRSPRPARQLFAGRAGDFDGASNLDTYDLRLLDADKLLNQGCCRSGLQSVVSIIDADAAGLQEIDDRAALMQIFDASVWGQMSTTTATSAAPEDALQLAVVAGETPTHENTEVATGRRHVVPLHWRGYNPVFNPLVR